MFSFGGTPYGMYRISDNDEFDEFTEKISKGTLELEKPNKCPNNVYDLMKMCWIIDYNMRPTFSKILCEIEEIFSNKESFDTHL
jgi:hypothetical protein